ncbi:MAG: MATE family efflux transporter [Christensenellaceae bacterium]|jgi:Na+-driven multidrug efflux pump
MNQAANSPNQNPLATEPVGKLILKFSVPSIISMIVNALYNMIDQIFIGQGIGMLGNAATNVAFPLTTISTAIALLVGIGSASNFNLRLGAGRKKQAARFMASGLSLSILFGTVLAVIVAIFMEPLLYAFGATEAVMPYAHPYTSIITLGIPFLVFSTAASNLIRAAGSPKYAMACIISGAIFNIIFDPIFMFGLDMGIEGIAWATTLGQVLSTGIAVAYFIRLKAIRFKRKYFLPHKAFTSKIMALGSASCFNQLAITVVQIALNNTLTYYGGMSAYGSEAPLAAAGVITKINMIFLSFAIGVAQGCQPINGFNYGAKNYARVRETIKKATIAVLVIGCIAFACFQLFPRQITLIFGEGSDEYFTFAERFLRIFMMMTFVNGIQPVAANFFTSIGKARKGIFISLTRQIIFLLPLVLILPVFMGVEGIVYAGPIADGVSAMLAILFIYRETKELRALEEGRLAAPLS